MQDATVQSAQRNMEKVKKISKTDSEAAQESGDGETFKNPEVLG